jgi:hypothetical protein
MLSLSSGSAASLAVLVTSDLIPVDLLKHFHSRALSDRERSQWEWDRRTTMWSSKCLLAELAAASTMFAKTGLMYAPSPRGEPFRPATSSEGHCALLMLAAFIPDNGADPNVYFDEHGSYAAPLHACMRRSCAHASRGSRRQLAQ